LEDLSEMTFPRERHFGQAALVWGGESAVGCFDDRRP